MKNMNPISAILGALAAAAIMTLFSAAQVKKSDADPMLEALKALTASQERQAAAWERLADKGWPTPQSVTLAGDIPRNLSVSLRGYVGVMQDGKWTVSNP